MGGGRLLGEGRTADVYEYGEDRVLKLLRPGLDPTLLLGEVELTRAAGSAGAPVPRVHGQVTIDGRPGIILDRARGSSLLDLLRDPEQASRRITLLPRTHAELWRLAAPDLPDVREVLHGQVETARGLSTRQRAAAINRVDALPGGNRLLHGDLHPSNVYVKGDRTTIIDWANAARGPAAADAARTLHLLSRMAMPPHLSSHGVVAGFAGELRETYRKTVLDLAGISNEEVGRWMLPILAARLSEGIEREHDPILARIESLTD